MTREKNRIVCGTLPPEQVARFLAYVKELIPGVESGATVPATGRRRIMATEGFEMHVKKAIEQWDEQCEIEQASEPRWAVAVTTIPTRQILLARTLQSITSSGFPVPDIYVDGPAHLTDRRIKTLSRTIRYRTENIKTYSHWLLTLSEMYLRDAEADRYIIFQDDLVCCQNMRAYLDMCQFPPDGFWNLYTTMGNDWSVDKLTRETSQKEYPHEGWHLSNQLGQGGLCFVFDNEAVLDLLTQRHMYTRMWDHSRRHRYMDGAVVTGMKSAGRKEYIHVPCLLQHTGHISSMENDWSSGKDQAATFRGEEWDCLTLFKG